MNIPQWANEVIACNTCQRDVVFEAERIVCPSCGVIGRLDDGVACFNLKDNASIEWYRNKGGTYFLDRSTIGYSMSALDTSIYHGYLERLKGDDKDGVILDAGSGDGRNSIPWVKWGFKRIVAIDAVKESLFRFRKWLHAQGLPVENVLCLEGDLRRLPIKTKSISLAFAIESLYYLNSEYEVGVADLHRVLSDNGRLLLSDRATEGALFTSLLYGGIDSMVKAYERGTMLDGPTDNLVETRFFEIQELVAILTKAGFVIEQQAGMPLLSLLLGNLNSAGKLGVEPEGIREAVHKMLSELGEKHSGRRTHVLFARKGNV